MPLASCRASSSASCPPAAMSGRARGERRDRQPGRDLAGTMPAHAVGHDVERRRDQERVLVARPDHAGVRGGAGADGQDLGAHVGAPAESASSAAMWARAAAAETPSPFRSKAADGLLESRPGHRRLAARQLGQRRAPPAPGPAAPGCRSGRPAGRPRRRGVGPRRCRRSPGARRTGRCARRPACRGRPARPPPPRCAWRRSLRPGGPAAGAPLRGAPRPCPGSNARPSPSGR